ncbi:MAG: hypothetical protein HKO63_04275 [Acidimicrobiia bacterium]|nr:hypothetical protein [Acidimicrobiia bacterium]NNF87326.1 hypothetical protein [Acidimicrobiia bacterium]NNJ47786.1 hypothetical protein [Acidimicrobiia bacterium]NNL14202.1 hypothetical protein [Acidimicrobiia bacterium]NNL97401.1 hypothetical protein [Acidimicrobiia bacterium]
MTPAFPVRAALLSVLGAVLGAVLWVLIAIAADLERAYPAILVGLLAGAAPRIEPRRGRPVQILALVMTVIGLVIVQYFVVRHSVVTELVENGRNRSLPMFLSPAAMWSVTFGWLRVYPIDAVVWVVSAAAAFALPRLTADEVVPLEAIQERAG